MALNVDVRELIRADILSGAFPFGARLRIEELSARYGLSHTPIREALRELRGEGLVTIEPNRGARVRIVDINLVDSLFDLRIAIEAMLTRRAAARISKTQLEQLDQIELELEKHAEAGNAHAVLLTNRRFHDLINDAADNPHASEILSRNWHLLSALWHRYGYPLARVTGVASDHRHLIRALAEHDGEAAAMIATAHAAKAKADLIRIMRSSGALSYGAAE
ncbi:MAG: GntR family transcriptional regulator [Proteobacteria bacterium]|nr:GntR family transcriptional regulator [Pseudomonadota bacterium]